MPSGEKEPVRDPRTGFEIWASCDDCGDVVIAGEACALVGRRPNVTLAYPCTECGRRSVSALGHEQLQGLLDRGFWIVDWEPPREPLERRTIAPPFTWNDLLDAHQLLQQTDFIVALLRT